MRKNNLEHQTNNMARKIIYLACISFLFACNNSETEDTGSAKNLLIHHNRPEIKSEECILIFDSATAYADIGDFVTAQKLLFKCNEIEPNNGTILNTIGASYFALKDSTEALKYFFTAIAADSLKPEAYASAGCLLEMQGKFTEAVSILKKGYAKSNTDQFTHYNICLNLAVTYLSLDSCSQAKKYLEITKQHGVDRPQFDNKVKHTEENLLNSCK